MCPVSDTRPPSPGILSSSPVASGRVVGALDLVAIGTVLIFAIWVIAGAGTSTVDTLLDYGLFFGIGLMVAVYQARAGRVASTDRERLAWQLLSAASFVRVTSGAVWALWLTRNGGAARPAWLLAITASALVLSVAGLLAFSTPRKQAFDRVRFGIDVVIVTAGSVTVLWFAALGPLFEATGAQAARLEDYIYLIADSVSAVIAAVLVLRSGQRYLRTVASLLLLAYLLQTVPDVLLWAGRANFSYRPGDAIGVLWFAVWVCKGLAARYAVHVLAEPDHASLQQDARYTSGLVPHAFVLAATVALLLQLAAAPARNDLPLIVATAALSVLLVLRQLVEIRERERLQAAQQHEAEWYGALLRDADEFVMVLDANGYLLEASPATTRLLDDANVRARPWALLELGHPDDREQLRRTLNTPQAAPRGLRFRLRGEPGVAWRDVALQITDRRHDPQASAIVLTGHDVTREARLSERLRQAEEFEALGVFAGGLAHDLNNILTVIDANAEMLLEEIPRDHALREDLAGISVASDRARRLTRGLLALSRRKPASIESINAERIVRARLEHAGLRDRVLLDMDPLLPLVQVDTNSLHLAVDALLLAVVESGADAGRVQLELHTVVLDTESQEHLHLEAGQYVTLTLRGLPARVGDTMVPTATAVWDGGSDQLPLLMAHAAVREIGGTLWFPPMELGVVTMYLPASGHR